MRRKQALKNRFICDITKVLEEQTHLYGYVYIELESVSLDQSQFCLLICDA